MCKIQGKLEHSKLKVVLDVVLVLFQNEVNKKNLRFLEDIVKMLCFALGNLQIPFYQQTDSLDYIKSINKMLVFLIFYHEELEKVTEASKG